MQMLLSVDAKLVGRKQPLIHGIDIAFDDLSQAPSLGEILARIVRVQVREFQERQADQRLTRFLTQTQIQTAAESGQVKMGGQDLKQFVDADQAIVTALQAFEDGLYLVFVDEKQYTQLDAVVPLQAHSQMTLVRLMLLAGG